MAARDQILLHLEERKGNWVSGESLAKKLAVSRSTIGRHISQLKSDGYPIESSPKKGYLLQKTSDVLTPREIRDGLETKVFGKRDIVCFTEADSTNTKAKDLATKHAPEGALVLSEKQTKGRGRNERNWFSPSRDGIYLSLILRPTIPLREAPVITLLTAVAVAEALLSLTSLKIAIKWPNDILVGRKKLAAAEDPQALFDKKVEEYQDLYLTPYHSASRSVIDGVIHPRDTRKQLISALGILKNKDEPPRPYRKHGNIPL